MSSIKARIQFSIDTQENWEKVNPQLLPGEFAVAQKTSGKYLLKIGGPGVGKYKDSVLVWDEQSAEEMFDKTKEYMNNAKSSQEAAAASMANAEASAKQAASSQSAAASSASDASAASSAAVASQQAAANSEANASTSASAAAESQKDAASAASAALTSENNAKASADAAKEALTSSSQAAESAKTYAESAKTSADNAKSATGFDAANYYTKTEVDTQIKNAIAAIADYDGNAF